MTSILRLFAFLTLMLLTLMLCACTPVRLEARLYPANSNAASTGVLDIVYQPTRSGHSLVELQMPGGELLRGEATVVRGGSVTFGNIFASVYGPRGTASGFSSGSSVSVPGTSPGTASLFGSRGTSMQCEFYNDNTSGHGYGGCELSNGALYRLQY